jgi:hypothetical protein
VVLFSKKRGFMKRSLFIFSFALISFVPSAYSATHVVPEAVVKEFNTQIEKAKKTRRSNSPVVPKAVVKEFNKQIEKIQKK